MGALKAAEAAGAKTYAQLRSHHRSSPSSSLTWQVADGRPDSVAEGDEPAVHQQPHSCALPKARRQRRNGPQS